VSFHALIFKAKASFTIKFLKVWFVLHWKQSTDALQNYKSNSYLSLTEACYTTFTVNCFFLYVSCPESIRPLWIFREPVAWPWWNLAASQRRSSYASVNNHSPVGLVCRQWDAVDWACVLCDRPIHNGRASRSASSQQCACPFYSSRACFLVKHHTIQVCQNCYSPDLAPYNLWLFPKLKSPLKGGNLWMRRSHSTQAQSTTSHRRVTSPTGEWLFTDA
jgi:hypothetical protein